MTSVTLANGAVNSSAGLDIKVNSTTKAISLNTSGAVGVGTTPDYGTAGQVLVSAGTAAAPAWSNSVTVSNATNAVNATNATTSTTAALGDSSTKIATTAFVAGTAFTNALPAQTGNAGKYVTTDGTTASWGGINAGNIRADFNKYDRSITLPSAGGTFIQCMSVQLSATSELLIVYSASGGATGVVWDDTNKVFGTPVQIRSASFSTTTGGVAAFAMSSTSVLVCSIPSASTSLQTVVLSISGTTITVNTAVASTLSLNGTIPPASVSNNGVGRIIQVGSSYILYYGEPASSVPRYRAITVSGTVPTVGSELSFTAGDIAGVSTIAVSSNSFLSFSRSTSTYFGVPVSVSGTTLTQGTQVTGTAAVTSFTQTTALLLPSGSVLCFYGVGTTIYTSIVVVNTTLNSASINTGSINTQVSYTNNASPNTYFQQFSSKVFVVSNDTSNNRLNVVTDVAGTPTIGTLLTNPDGASVTWNIVGCDASQIFMQSGANFYVYSNTGNNPTLIKAYPSTVTTGATGVASSIGSYSGFKPNIENAPILRTSSYKSSYLPSDGSYLATSFDGTASPSLQFGVGTTSAGTSIKSSLNSYSGWISYWNSNAALNTVVNLRRVELV
jgi:hypothetical protein